MRSLTEYPSVSSILIRMAQSDVEDYNLDKVEPDLRALKGLAAALLPVIREFYTHEENVRAFEAWLKERESDPQKHSKRK